MNKPAQNLLFGIGIFSIFFGIYLYFSEIDKFNSYSGIIFGIILISGVFIAKKGLDNEDKNKK